MYQEEFRSLVSDQRESETELEWEGEELEGEEVQLALSEQEARNTVAQIRDSATFAISFFDRGRVSDAIADLVFIKSNAEKLLSK